MYWRPGAVARRGFQTVLFTEPSDNLCRRYMRSTECPSSFYLFHLCNTGQQQQAYLCVGSEEIDDTEDRNERYTDEPHECKFPQRHRLQESHFCSVPHARQMLLTVGVGDKLKPHPVSNDALPASFQDQRSKRNLFDLII